MPRRLPRPWLTLTALLVPAFGHAAAPEVSVEVRFLAVPPRIVDKFLKDGSPATFDAAKVRELLGEVQGDLGASVLHSLKVTATAGQRCSVGEDHDLESDGGVALVVLPTVSADRRSVRVALKAELTPVNHSSAVMRPQEGHTIGVNVSFTAGDGRTVLFEAGDRTRTVHETEKVPVLGDVPYLGRLFTKETTRRDEERILILVTPRIVRERATDGRHAR